MTRILALVLCLIATSAMAQQPSELDLVKGQRNAMAAGAFDCELAAALLRQKIAELEAKIKAKDEEPKK